MYDLLKDLNYHSRKFLVLFSIYYVFVLMSLYIFKSSLFDKIFYIPFIIGFCLSVVGFLMNLASIFALSKDIDKQLDQKENSFVENASASSIIGLCFSILISYYYSLSFTKFLIVSFTLYVCWFIIAFIIAVFVQSNTNSSDK